MEFLFMCLTIQLKFSRIITVIILPVSDTVCPWLRLYMLMTAHEERIFIGKNSYILSMNSAQDI